MSIFTKDSEKETATANGDAPAAERYQSATDRRERIRRELHAATDHAELRGQLREAEDERRRAGMAVLEDEYAVEVAELTDRFERLGEDIFEWAEEGEELFERFEEAVAERAVLRAQLQRAKGAYGVLPAEGPTLNRPGTIMGLPGVGRLGRTLTSTMKAVRSRRRRPRSYPRPPASSPTRGPNGTEPPNERRT